MSESEEVKRLERHLGLLSSRLDGYEGRVKALEIQHDEMVKVGSKITEGVTKVATNLDAHIRMSSKSYGTSSTNLSNLIRVVEGLTKTVGEMQTLMNSQSVLYTVSIILSKAKTPPEQDRLIAEIPDEQMRREVLEQFEKARKLVY